MDGVGVLLFSGMYYPELNTFICSKCMCVYMYLYIRLCICTLFLCGFVYININLCVYLYGCASEVRCPYELQIEGDTC